MNILVDYLTLSIRLMKLDDLLDILHVRRDQFMSGGSWLGLSGCLRFGGIKVHYGDYLVLEMTGSGCRLLESLYDCDLNWIDFIEQFLCLEGSHLARLDIACDDKPGEGEKGVLSFPLMLKHLKQRKYVSLSHRKIFTDGDEQNIVFGSPKSDRRLRIYNKAMERGYDGHWIRAEFQLRNETALSFYMRALEHGSIGVAYQGMLYDFLRFTREVNEVEDKHQSRLTVTRWWLKFCGTSKKIKGFYVGGLEYNMDSLTRYLNNNVGSSIKTFLTMSGGNVSELVDIADKSQYNKRQDFLVKTLPLIQQMHATYDPAPEQKPVRRLTRSEALAFGLADREQRRVDECREHWHSLSCSLDSPVYSKDHDISDDDLF